MFSVSTIQLCPRILSIAVDNMEIHGLGCVPAGLLTSLAPSPTNLPLLHRASATQAPSFSFWNILSLFPPALGTLHYLFPIVGSSVPTSAHAWFPLAIHLSVYHLPLRKVFITTNQLATVTDIPALFSRYSALSDSWYKGFSPHNNGYGYKPLIFS